MQFKKNNKFLLIFNVILFLFQFESFGEDVFSVYRFLIFPLLCLGLLYIPIKLYKADSLYLFVVVVFLITQSLSALLSGNYSYLINVLGQLLFFLISYAYIKSSINISKSTLFVFASYSFFHFLFFLLNLGTINLAHRFSGYHWDPNYMCAYILIGLWAKVYLIKLFDLKLLYKYLFFILSIFDVIMILSSMSKGGVLALVFSLLLYLFINKRVVFYSSLFFLFLCTLMIIGRFDSLVWSTDLSLVDSLIYRFVNQSIESGDISTGRIDFIYNYIYMIMSGDAVILGVDIQYFITEYNFNAYPHNGFLEILISSGLICGSIFISMVIFLLFKSVITAVYYRKLYYYLLITVCSLFVFFFLSYLGLKFFWFLIAVLIVFQSNKLYKI